MKCSGYPIMIRLSNHKFDGKLREPMVHECYLTTQRDYITNDNTVVGGAGVAWSVSRPYNFKAIFDEP